MVAPSSAGVQVLAGLIEAARLMTWRIGGASSASSRATATAVLMVPHVPCEWTLGRAVVAPPSREPTS